jgi:hypothetical protein
VEGWVGRAIGSGGTDPSIYGFTDVIGMRILAKPWLRSDS